MYDPFADLEQYKREHPEIQVILDSFQKCYPIYREAKEMLDLYYAMMHPVKIVISDSSNDGIPL